MQDDIVPGSKQTILTSHTEHTDQRFADFASL